MFFVYDGRKYAFDLFKIKSLCLISDGQVQKETEITEAYEYTDGESSLANRIERELKTPGNVQNDTIMYDLIKSFMTPILTCEIPALDNKCDKEEDGAVYLDIATAISFNTLLDAGLIKDVTDMEEKK